MADRCRRIFNCNQWETEGQNEDPVSMRNKKGGWDQRKRRWKHPRAGHVNTEGGG